MGTEVPRGTGITGRAGGSSPAKLGRPEGGGGGGGELGDHIVAPAEAVDGGGSAAREQGEESEDVRHGLWGSEGSHGDWD